MATDAYVPFHVLQASGGGSSRLDSEQQFSRFRKHEVDIEVAILRPSLADPLSKNSNVLCTYMVTSDLKRAFCSIIIKERSTKVTSGRK
jgi:hypothetical protein